MAEKEGLLYDQPPAIGVVSPFRTQALSGLKYFFALSRLPHCLMDIATPALAALLWHGGFPSWRIIVLGLIAAFAGYTAIYALNDLIDLRVDQEKMKQSHAERSKDYLDAWLSRHPIAQGLLSYRKGVIWVVVWTLIAFVSAYLLNPVCAVILLLGAGLEAVYCLTIKVTHLRTLVSGAVKNMGGLAAVFAVDPSPSPIFLSLLFAWIFFWEIGGQKIPADWHDIEEDRKFGAKTIPVLFGRKGSGRLVVLSLMMTLILTPVLLHFAPASVSGISLMLSVIIGIYLLLMPAIRLYARRTDREVSVLFRRASFFPAAMLMVVLLHLTV
jgi:4-hydroxybenzoate polyprenyltransferase